MANRISQVVVRFSPDELAHVRALARDANEPLARYLRRAALDHSPRPGRVDSYADLVRSLNEVSDALDRAQGQDVASVLHQLRVVLTSIADRMSTGPHGQLAGDVAALE